MEKCMGCLGIAWGRSSRRNKLKYRVNYGNSDKSVGGVEFENLVLEDEENHMNYGTTCHFVSQEEKEIIARREYDRILEQQKKIDEQIDRQTFEEEERLKIEEERFREAQLEASRAVSAALKVQQYSKAGIESTNNPDHSLYSIDDSEDNDDDFESFLESVKVRSEEFRNNKTEYVKTFGTNNNKIVSMQPKKLSSEGTLSPDFSKRPREIDGIADGMSSDESFSYDQPTSGPPGDNPEMEWDKFVDGLDSQDIEPRERSETEIEVLKKTAEEFEDFT